MWHLLDRVLAYSVQHPYLMHSAHFAAGFGVALLLQHYLKGHEFVSPIVGWILIGFSVVVHVVAVMAK